ncbi:hypothetical protein ACWDT6_30220 [Nocardia grenadensis]
MPRTKKRRPLTAEQQPIADRLERRAHELRAAADADGDGLSIRAAIDIAATELGLGPQPQP